MGIRYQRFFNYDCSNTFDRSANWRAVRCRDPSCRYSILPFPLKLGWGRIQIFFFFQLVLLPNDERVLGETHLMDILKDTIKMQTGAPLMYPGYGS